jgi:hypothetical protein
MLSKIEPMSLYNTHPPVPSYHLETPTDRTGAHIFDGVVVARRDNIAE